MVREPVIALVTGGGEVSRVLIDREEILQIWGKQAMRRNMFACLG
jgi:hypothetical protein